MLQLSCCIFFIQGLPMVTHGYPTHPIGSFQGPRFRATIAILDSVSWEQRLCLAHSTGMYVFVFLIWMLQRSIKMHQVRLASYLKWMLQHSIKSVLKVQENILHRSINDVRRLGEISYSLKSSMYASSTPTPLETHPRTPPPNHCKSDNSTAPRGVPWPKTSLIQMGHVP